MNIRTNFLRFQVYICLLAAGLFSSMAEAATYSVLTKFNGSNGTTPLGSLVQGADGNFYGTTNYGGSSNKGTVFKVTSAGVLTTLLSFTGPNGSHPYGTLIQGTGTDTNFYGTTRDGGTVGGGFGTIFKITPTGALTTLINFTGHNGANPFSGLVEDSKGNFYGTTNFGGSSNMGTVFKLDTTGVLTTLVKFNGTNGAYPYSSLVLDANSNLYGTTFNGGSAGLGTIFEVTSAGVLSTLITFDGTNGAYPYAGLVQAKNGTFYGTTEYSSATFGVSGYGTVFSLNSGVLTTLVNFNNTDGNDPQSTLVQGTDGDFYGTTIEGGSSGGGTLYKVTSAGDLTTLINCSAVNGSYPEGGLVQAKDGNFYGTTINDTPGNMGLIYRLNATSVFPVAFNSPSTIGETNQGFIIDDSLLNLNLGVSLNVGDVLTVIHNTSGNPISGTFTNLPNGGTITGVYYSQTYLFTANYSGNGGHDLTLTVKSTLGYTVINTFSSLVFPEAGLVEGSDGDFYGTTPLGGGTPSYGTVFKIKPYGGLTNLVHFDSGPAGGQPVAALVPGRGGNFYGTTNGGGYSDNGTVFVVTPAGGLNKLADAAPGIGPNSLAAGADGNFYGTTDLGGSGSYGIVFKITPTGVLTALANFNYTNGAGPNAIVQGADGNFYGTTSGGGSAGDGTFFQLTPAGVLTTLVNFNGANGDGPNGPLIQGSDGNFYATTVLGGSVNHGTVFKVTPAGVLTTLVSFNSTNGARPEAGVVEGTDGNFYGTTQDGGLYGLGTGFKVTPAGALTTLFNFNGMNGANPMAPLVQGSDGNFYGSTTFGGTATGQGFGVIFRF